MNKIERLEEIIRGYDELVDYWFSGIRPCDVDEEYEGGIYATADEYRNQALKMLGEMKKGLDSLM